MNPSASPPIKSLRFRTIGFVVSVLAALAGGDLLLSAFWLLLCKIEGVVCILMETVLAAAITFIAILISWAIQRSRRRGHYHCLLLLILRCR